jgi:hypothetical protein
VHVNFVAWVVENLPAGQACRAVQERFGNSESMEPQSGLATHHDGQVTREENIMMMVWHGA